MALTLQLEEIKQLNLEIVEDYEEIKKDHEKLSIKFFMRKKDLQSLRNFNEELKLENDSLIAQQMSAII